MYDTPKLKNACGVICRPSVSTVSKDAGIKPKTVATSALAVKSSNHLARSHPQKNIKMKIYLICSVADPDPGSGIGCFLTPGFGIRDGRKSASGSGIRDEQPGSYFLLFFWVKILKFFDEDPGSGMETVRIRDPGWKKVGSGINIPDPQHCIQEVNTALVRSPIKLTAFTWNLTFV
jgi:hypothetical protein